MGRKWREEDEVSGREKERKSRDGGVTRRGEGDVSLVLVLAAGVAGRVGGFGQVEREQLSPPVTFYLMRR